MSSVEGGVGAWAGGLCHRADAAAGGKLSSLRSLVLRWGMCDLGSSWLRRRQLRRARGAANERRAAH